MPCPPAGAESPPPNSPPRDAHEEAQHRRVQAEEVDLRGREVVAEVVGRAVQHVAHRLREEYTEDVHDERQQDHRPDQRLPRLRGAPSSPSYSLYALYI